MSKLDDFKVEELEQRLEMGSWDVGTETTPSPDGFPYTETSYHVTYTHTF